MKLNIFPVWENIPDFEKDEKKFSKYEIQDQTSEGAKKIIDQRLRKKLANF